jgi:nucleotide-binding universal stress UspA family protein
MYQTIVVGTDGSETADVALGRAVDLARLSEAALHVVSAYAPASARVGGTPPAGEAAEWSVGPDFKVEAVIDRASERLRDAGVKAAFHTAKGDPADAIVAAAEQHGADLIVLGSKGMQGARRVLGSVPNKVSHRAPCDVLIVQTT